jgi:hypothetical protein
LDGEFRVLSHGFSPFKKSKRKTRQSFEELNDWIADFVGAVKPNESGGKSREVNCVRTEFDARLMRD